MTTKHTPGPWTASSMVMDAEYWAELGKGSIAIVRRGQDVVAAVWGCDDDTDEDEAANARLIAAAPTMLAALEKALVAIEVWGAGPMELRDEIRAAIAKARGE